jgi:hypothetical protein
MEQELHESLAFFHALLNKLWFEEQGQKKICGFPVSSYKNLGRVGRF